MAAAILHKSKYLSDLLLNYGAGTTPGAAPSSLYAALLTTFPTKNDGTSLVEVSATSTGYARQAITSAQWAAITTAVDNFTEQSATNIALQWSNSGASNFGTVVGIALYDASTNGNAWYYAQLQDGSGNATSYTISAGNIFQIPSGSVVRQES